jgi:hypothetical protein
MEDSRVFPEDGGALQEQGGIGEVLAARAAPARLVTPPQPRRHVLPENILGVDRLVLTNR